MVIDWAMTIVGAVLIVFAVKTWVVNPYRIPSPSMEPTLHCALPEPDCEASTSDRLLRRAARDGRGHVPLTTAIAAT